MERWILILACLMATASARAITAVPETYVLCKSQKNVRTIRVDKDGTGTCTTTYTKEGVDRIVGASRSLQSCRSYLNNIRDNLEDAAWRCRDISSADITGPKGSDEARTN